MRGKGFCFLAPGLTGSLLQHNYPPQCPTSTVHSTFPGPRASRVSFLFHATDSCSACRFFSTKFPQNQCLLQGPVPVMYKLGPIAPTSQQLPLSGVFVLGCLCWDTSPWIASSSILKDRFQKVPLLRHHSDFSALQWAGVGPSQKTWSQPGGTLPWMLLSELHGKCLSFYLILLYFL